MMYPQVARTAIRRPTATNAFSHRRKLVTRPIRSVFRVSIFLLILSILAMTKVAYEVNQDAREYVSSYNETLQKTLEQIKQATGKINELLPIIGNVQKKAEAQKEVIDELNSQTNKEDDDTKE